MHLLIVNYLIIIIIKLYLYVGTGYPCAGHNMFIFCNNLVLKDSAIIGNLGAVELTGSSIFFKRKVWFYFKSL